ncbi:hypothetical protein ACFLTR_04540 [Chloroflexota bacterium]
MCRKVLVGTLLALSLLLNSCYPELSVQQYDKLKSDIAALDTERKELEAKLSTLEVKLSTLEVELRAIEAKNVETLAYVNFLEKVLSAQSSELILSGQFDIETLIDSSVELTSTAEKLGNDDIIYYLGLFDSDNETQSVGAYYKVIEYSLKNIKQNLE